MTEWISVKDKMPDKRQQVLFTNGFTVLKGIFVPLFSNEYRDIENVFCGENGGIFTTENWNVTHWMPLPNPPSVKII